MSEVITSLNKYEGNDVFTEYPIGTSADYVSYGDKTVKYVLDNPSKLKIYGISDSSYVTYDGKPGKDIEIRTVGKLGDLGSLKENRMSHLKREKEGSTKVQRKYADGSLAITVPSYDSSNTVVITSGNTFKYYQVLRGFRWLASIKIPANQSWLVTYNVIYSNMYHNQGKSSNKDEDYYDIALTSKELGSYSMAVFNEVAHNSLKTIHDIIEMGNGYTGMNLVPVLSTNTILSKTIVLPRTSTSTTLSKDKTYYLWTAHDATVSLPIGFDITAIRIY